MKLLLHLSDVDAKRFDVSEPPVLDFDTVSFREVLAMQRGFDVDGQLVAFDTANHWRNAFLGPPVLGPDGKPEMVEVRDAAGEPVLDDQDQPVWVQRRTTDWGALLVGAWLALRRAGKAGQLAEVADCDPERVRWELLPDDQDDEQDPAGKGESGRATTF